MEIILFFLPTPDFVDFQYVPDRVNMNIPVTAGIQWQWCLAATGHQD